MKKCWTLLLCSWQYKRGKNWVWTLLRSPMDKKFQSRCYSVTNLTLTPFKAPQTSPALCLHLSYSYCNIRQWMMLRNMHVMSSGQSQTCSKLIRWYQAYASFLETEKVWSCWFQYKHKHLWTMTWLHHKQNEFCPALPKLRVEKFPSIDHRKHWVSETKKHRCFIGTVRSNDTEIQLYVFAL